MKSTAHLRGHPLHPMLIPYPFALLSGATVFDIGANITSQRSWAETGKHMTAAGIGTALIARSRELLITSAPCPRERRRGVRPLNTRCVTSPPSSVSRPQHHGDEAMDISPPLASRSRCSGQRSSGWGDGWAATWFTTTVSASLTRARC